MKRRLAVLVLALLTGLVMHAFCSATQEGTAKPVERPKIVFLRRTGNNPYAIDVKPDDRYFQEVSRLSGYDFSMEYLQQTNYMQLLSLRFASGELPDVVLTDTVDSQFHQGAVQAGVFVDLTDLIPKHAPDMWAKMPAEYWKNPAVSYNGRIYGVPVLKPLLAWRLVMYRKDFLDTLKMAPPLTLNDYLPIFAKAKATDLNNNGQADEIPYVALRDFGYSELPWGTFGVFPGVWRLRGGRLMPDLIAPGMRDALEFWRKLYEQGFVNYDMFTRTGTDRNKDIYAGKVMFWTHDAMNLATTWSPDKFAEEAVLDVLPGPKDSTGATPLLPDSDAFANVWVVNARTKDPVAVVKFFNWLWSDDLAKEMFFILGIKGYNYTEEGGTIIFDASAPQNIGKNAMDFIQLMVNPRGDYRMNPLFTDFSPRRDVIRKAIPAAAQSTFTYEGKYLPILDALKENPSLESGGGSLFMDMAARVVTGKEDATSAFNAFVAEWTRRGGEAAIEEANAWYAKSR